ncbi:MAG: DUF362 domain-containing protein [Chitinispirillaceae bacterium]|nr:DUF362 domain-containing protein [Chitinispirillaceae bacterium]
MSLQSDLPYRALVAVVRCTSYEQEVVDAAVKRGIGLLGGAELFAAPGEKIVFKPNVLWGTDPSKGIVTHPSVLRAVIGSFSASGAELQYGDSSAGLPNEAKSMRRCGYMEALKALPVSHVSFLKKKVVEWPEGIAGKKLELAEAVVDADGVINLPKLKTHGLVRMTGAVKNCFGCIPGATKGAYHARFPDVYDFSNLLADIATCVRPRLHIMDAVEAMEGNGPQSGSPKKLGVLLFSTDPVALDSIACRLIHLDTRYVPTIVAAERTGLGIGNPQQIDLTGDPIEEFIDRSFDVLRAAPVRIASDGILKNVKRFFLPRPVIRKNRCTRCGRCVSVCPVQPPALKHIDTVLPPVYDYRICIRCYCCQEVCPSKAIVIREPLMARVLPYMTYIALLVTRHRTRAIRSTD